MGIWAHSWYYWKALDEYDLMKVISKYKNLKCWILSIFCHRKFNLIIKDGSRTKSQLGSQFTLGAITFKIPPSCLKLFFKSNIYIFL
jgi:hypothetical protein